MRGAHVARTERARRLRREPTDAEKKLWYRIRARSLGGHKFVRQEPTDRIFMLSILYVASGAW